MRPRLLSALPVLALLAATAGAQQPPKKPAPQPAAPATHAMAKPDSTAHTAAKKHARRGTAAKKHKADSTAKKG